MLLIKILILIILLAIFIQDIISRYVYWILFPPLALSFILMHVLQHEPFKELWIVVLINLVFLAIQLGIVTLYFSFKKRHWVNITSQMIGWGDILFLLCISFYFSNLNFLLFYLTSLILSLFFWLIWQSFLKTKNKQIPLAGLQSLLLTLFLSTDWYCIHINSTNDSWLLKILIK